jgi:acetyltransferase-like isoleucine patch superfamily enzyme
MFILSRIFRKLSAFRAKFRTAASVLQLRLTGASVGTSVLFEGRHRFDIAPGGTLVLGNNVTLGDGIVFEIGPGAALTIKQGVRIRESCIVRCFGELTIGERTFINAGVFCESIGGMVIGEDVLIAPRVHLYDFDHNLSRLDVPIMAQPIIPGQIVIGNGAWLCADAIILGNVSVGEGAVVGAGAVVTKDVPRHAIAVGIPARVSRYRAGTATEGQVVA